MRQLEDVACNPAAVAAAASALWALLHRGERVKATLKGLPGAVATVQSCAQASARLATASAQEKDAAGDSCRRCTSEAALSASEALHAPTIVELEGVTERSRWLKDVAHTTRLLSRVLTPQGA